MGCGVCAGICEKKAIDLIDIANLGIRPLVNPDKCEQCGNCIKVCPGIEIRHKPFTSEAIPKLLNSWGPVLELWEGYATDPEIRYAGSSGGVATALALFLLEEKLACDVLHIGTNIKNPLRNIPVLSKSKDELLLRTGSRYSPAAPCEKINWIREAKNKSVFIGKPCDVAALRKAQSLDPLLDNKTIIAISIFCAGTPTTNGTHKLLEMLDIAPEKVGELRYRGNGWPGKFTVKKKDNSSGQVQMAYQKAWGSVLTRYVQFRCRLCPDSSGEFADISCGAPWHRKIEPDEQGQSLVLVRTEQGSRILHDAMDKRYVEMQKVEPEVLPASQESLLNKRRNIHGRLLTMQMLFIPTPKFTGFNLFSNWCCLSWLDRIHSILGTCKRIILRKLYRPKKYWNTISELNRNSVRATTLGNDWTEQD